MDAHCDSWFEKSLGWKEVLGTIGPICLCPKREKWMLKTHHNTTLDIYVINCNTYENIPRPAYTRSECTRTPRELPSQGDAIAVQAPFCKETKE